MATLKRGLLINLFLMSTKPKKNHKIILKTIIYKFDPSDQFVFKSILNPIPNSLSNVENNKLDTCEPECEAYARMFYKRNRYVLQYRTVKNGKYITNTATFKQLPIFPFEVIIKLNYENNTIEYTCNSNDGDELLNITYPGLPSHDINIFEGNKYYLRFSVIDPYKTIVKSINISQKK